MLGFCCRNDTKGLMSHVLLPRGRSAVMAAALTSTRCWPGGGTSAVRVIPSSTPTQTSRAVLSRVVVSCSRGLRRRPPRVVSEREDLSARCPIILHHLNYAPVTLFTFFGRVCFLVHLSLVDFHGRVFARVFIWSF